MPEFRTSDEFAVIGIAARTSNAAEASSTGKIRGLWSEYFASQVSSRVPNRAPDQSTFAVYTDYESDHAGQYTLVLGQRVDSLNEIPPGMIGLKIPGGRYLVFSADGPMPDAIVTAWTGIWSYFEDNKEYTRAYSSDFEIYHDGTNRAEIHIAVR